jgi:hypothetical protein
MSAAFIPTFTRELTLNGKPQAWRLGNNLLNGLLITTGAIVVGGMVFARPLIEMYAGDFASVPGKLDLTVRLTRVMLPFLTPVAVAAAVMGMLNSLHQYFVPALSPGFQHRTTSPVRSARAAHAGARLAADRWRSRCRRLRVDSARSRSMAIARARGFRTALHPRDPGLRRAGADGPRHDWTRGRAG